MRSLIYGKIMLAGTSLLFLSGCMQFELSVENLMRPPTLTQEQLEISTALERAVGDSDIKYKYPETGENRSSFVFYDIDGDETKEALVFYQAESRGSATWVNILDYRNDGWVSLFDIAAPNGETEVDFISFQPLLSDSDSIVIGWADEYMNGKCAVVYEYDGSSLNEVFSQEYDHLAFTDLNSDSSLDMVAILSDPFYEETSIAFVTRKIDISGYTTLQKTSELELPYYSAEFISVQSGQIDRATTALFIDSMVNTSRSQSMLVSQALTAYGDDLVNLLDGGETSLSAMTLRSTSAICQDINEDGIIEVPTVSPLPGYEEEEEQLYLTTYNQLGVGRSWQQVSHWVINEDHRYQLRFPEEWLGAVTIVSQQESNEWSFIRYNGTLEDTSSLLLRLKVYSAKDYHDKFESEYFDLLGQQGLFEYYAHIPESDDALAISAEELTELFQFIQ